MIFRYISRSVTTAIFGIASLIGFNSCKKYLDEKPQERLVVPSSLKDLQALLDNNATMNATGSSFMELVGDNIYLTTNSWKVASLDERSNYIWDRNAYLRTFTSPWDVPYAGIYSSNVVLEALSKIDREESNTSLYNEIKGSALFHRAFLFHILAQQFCKPYSSDTKSDLGIVLRLSAAIEDKSVRATVQSTYDQIINDLIEAASLLPQSTAFSTRPNKAAAFGELARVCLSIGDYTNANKYADSSLALYSSLLDYNLLNASNNPPMPNILSNPEVIYMSRDNYTPGSLAPSYALIDSSLYNSYNVNDLRKTIFFDNGSTAGTHSWRGSYDDFTGAGKGVFDGLATDEIYLIRAECRARNSDAPGAMLDLNTLMRKRWKTNSYTDMVATNATDALNKVLIERRKELLFRSLRWSDLRRLNLEGKNITLARTVDNLTYTLPPNDLRWVLLIPDREIARSGIQQNPR